MYPVHHVPAGDVLPIFFDTFAGSTGASITMTGFAVTDIEIYKDGSATQRASDAGITLLDTDGIDFDGITGIHGFSIDTGNNSDADFYTVGAWFHVVVSAVTVDGQSISFVAAAFRIMAAENSAGVPAVDVTSMQAGTVTASALATDAVDEIVDAVWDEATAGHASAGTTGAVLGALGSMIENTSDGWIWTVASLQQAPSGGLDAAGVRAAIGLASANLDTQLDALPTAAENAAAVMGSTIEGTFDLTESARLWNAALAGKASGLATTTATFRDLADTKDRIVATVDTDGNRTAITRDVT